MRDLSGHNDAAVRRGFRAIAITVCTSAFLLSTHSARAAQAPACSQQTVDTLEDDASRVNSWPQVAEFYHRYQSCKIDDADVQEGISDSIARLLANHWDTLPEAAQLFAHDAALEKFALAGINITDSTDDLNRIDALATKNCPVGLNVLCNKIRKAIRENN